MTTRFAPFVALALLIAGLTAVPAPAQNLVMNPHFDVGVAGWEAAPFSNVTLAWDGTRDADGSFVSC